MKIFQILNSACHWDATDRVHTIDESRVFYSPDIIFVEAPDYVFEGWGYNENAEGDAKFIKPVPPKGMLYDEKTGKFYPEWEKREDLEATFTKPVQSILNGI